MDRDVVDHPGAAPVVRLVVEEPDPHVCRVGGPARKVQQEVRSILARVGAVRDGHIFFGAATQTFFDGCSSNVGEHHDVLTIWGGEQIAIQNHVAQDLAPSETGGISSGRLLVIQGHWGYGALASLVALPLLRQPVAALGRFAYGKLGLRPPARGDWRALRHQVRIVSSLRFDRLAVLVGRLSCQTLVCHSVDDPLVEVAIARENVGRLPDGEALIFDDGGHYPQKHHAAAIAAAMAHRFAGLGLTRPTRDERARCHSDA